jgi:phage tail sheath gpL-like
MGITFNSISPNARASATFIELAGVKRSFASLFIKPCVGIIGQYDSAKTGVVPYAGVKVSSAEHAGEIFGYGSHLHRQALAMPAAVFNSGNGAYCFPVPDPEEAESASETITIVGTAIDAGTLYFRIGGVYLSLNVAKDSTPDDVAIALSNAIISIRDIAVTAAESEGTVTVTAKFSGDAGNEIVIIQNPGGDSEAMAGPGGLTVAIGNDKGYLSGGTGAPDIHSVFFNADGTDKLGGTWYTQFTLPYTDSQSISEIKAAGNMRVAPETRRMFCAFAGYVQKSYFKIIEIAGTINSKWIAPVWFPDCYAPAFELAAALCGRVAYEQNIAPNRPYKNTEIGLPCNTDAIPLRYGERDELFRKGISYCYIAEDGMPYFGDIALSYRKTSTGADTEEWFDAVSLACRQAKSYSLEQIFESEPYTRAVVVDNDSITDKEWAIAPKDVIADMAKLIEDLWAPEAWTKNATSVIDALTSEINAGNNSRIDGQVIDDEAKALRIIAMKYAYLY